MPRRNSVLVAGRHRLCGGAAALVRLMTSEVIDQKPPTCHRGTMNELLSWSGRVELAGVLLMVGAGLMGAGVRSVAGGLRRRKRSWLAWALTYLYAFRRIVVGLCCLGAGVGLADGVAWLLAASVCVGLGELLESSYYIMVIRWGHPSAQSALET
jgi:hypothetical protein